MADFLLVFDLDGTLIDTVPDLANALNHVLRQHGHAPFSPREVQAMVGDGIPALVTRGFAARGADAAEAKEALPRFLALYQANAANLSRPYPGVRDTLVALRRQGYRTAVCTNKAERATEAVLRGLDLFELFDGIAGGDHFPMRKPDPGHLLGLIDELRGGRERAAMIGDNENDAAAAHAAGLPLILMRYGYARVDPATLHAAALLDRFTDLPETLRRLGLIPS
jgi:phosphoglycolate phosphatase